MRVKRSIALATAEPPAGGARYPRLDPFPRCRCGICRDCVENDRWDRIFARHEKKHYWEDRGIFQSTLAGL